jgi:hypothetical protein
MQLSFLSLYILTDQETLYYAVKLFATNWCSAKAFEHILVAPNLPLDRPN